MMVMVMTMMMMMTMLNHRFEERWLIPDDSYLAKFWDDQKEFFKQGGERGTIYFADFNLTNNQLERITQLVKNLKNETKIISEVDQCVIVIAIVIVIVRLTSGQSSSLRGSTMEA